MAKNSKKISARTISPRKYIELYGMFGKFDLPSKSIKVRYFSTIASGNDKRSDAFSLLRELKPMRERVKASEIKDLSSLLQRNLDDYRVAYELIPYLLNNEPQIAFFPAVLGVLLPNDFLKTEGIASYPIKKTINDGLDGESAIYSFDDKWKIEQFHIGTSVSNLGILSIDLSDIEIVVLDGQHRANAFRVASGAFSEKDSSVYPAFYKDIPQNELDADLPITLVWFENESTEFDPRYVSRRLFVDVNNTAKKVSKSRKILLNDYEVASLLTRFFYSSIAENKSFSLDNFSLFHSEFDKDSDITVSSNNVLAITNPEFIHEIISWLTLGSRAFNSLNSYRSKDLFKGNAAEFSEIFDSEELNGNDINPYDEILNSRIVVLKDFQKITSFENEYKKKLHLPIYNIFDRFNLFQKHFKACKEIGVWYDDGMNSYQRTVWEEVFCGGEGLYYTFKNKEIIKGKVNASLTNFLIAIDEIEKRFRYIRAINFNGLVEKDVNSAFDSANTKAFQIGLFMALDIYKEDRSFFDAYEDFLTRLNSIPENSWIIILNEIRAALINGVDPKQWPAYQKLILRIIQIDERYYNKDNFIDSPDGVIFKDNLLRSFNAWYENQDDLIESELCLDTISNEVIIKWAKNAKDETDKLFSKASIKPIKDANFENIALLLITKEVNKINPQS